MDINIKNKERITDIYTIICLLVIIVITIYMIIIPPFVGIANNGDFERFANKIGIFYPFNAWSEENSNNAFFHNTIAKYVIKPSIDTGFFSSYELIACISRGLCSLFSKTGEYDIRFMGITSFIFTYIGISLLFYAIRDLKNSTRMIIQTIVTFCVLDPYFVQFYNSFYSEQGIFLFGFYFVTFFIITCKNFTYISFALELGFALLMSLAKAQYIVILAPCLLLVLLQFFFCKFKKSSLIVVLFFLFIVGMIPQLMPNIGVGNSHKDANNLHYNVIMQRLLRLSEDPQSQLRNLGFSEEDIEVINNYIGTNAFTSSFQSDYPEIASKFDVKMELQLLINEPMLIIKSLMDVEDNIFGDMGLGNFAESEYADMKCQSLGVMSKFAELFITKSFIFYAAVFILAIGFGFMKLRKKEPISIVWLFIIGSAILLYMVVPFGDGNEDSKHMYAASIALEIVYIYVIFNIAMFCMKFIKPYFSNYNWFKGKIRN